MSVAEIKDALPSLTRAEFAEIARTIAELETAHEPQPTMRDVGPTDPAFLAAKEKVFREHHELFRRLAE